MEIGEPGSKDYRRRQLEAKLRPESIRATLGFAGLFQMTHEMIKTAVLDKVHEFYWQIEDGAVVYDEQRYDDKVRGLAPHKFEASLLWLVEGGSITLAQADRLEDIVAHRHELSHDLIKYIVDPDFDPDVELLTDALVILNDIHRFFTSFEKDGGSFDDFGDVDLDEIVPLSLSVLQMCIDAYVDGLRSSE